MKFTKLATSDSFNYKMLNRLQQDCKYFIEHPNLKHLWAQDIDAQIKEMLKIYTSLDPKPEWISEDEIYNYEKQMKEVYTNKKDAFRNNWMNPKFEKESANDITFKVFYINDDMEKTEYKSFVDDKKAEQCAYKLFDKFKHQEPVWVERYKGNYDDGYTLLDLDPDTYDRKPIYKSYKSGYTNGKKDYNVGKVFDVDDLESNWRYSKEWKEGYWQGVADAQEKEFYKQSAIQQPNKPKPTTMLPDNMQWAWDPDAADWVAVLKDNDNTTPPLYDPNNQNVTNQTTSYMSTVKSASCLSEFLDGPRYSKEIKIEAGLIKEGLVKYAGFDFNRGTKYAITDKGLEVLRKASEKEHNEALNEREKLAYMFGFNTDEVSTLDTTGKTIKSEGTKKFNVKSLINKLYSEIKKSRGHWEGIDPLEYTYIDAKDVDDGTEIQVRDELSYEGMMKLAELLNKIIKEVDPQAYFEPLEPGIMIAFISDGNNKNASKKLAKKYTICEADDCELGEVEASSELDAKVKFGIEHPEYADSLSIKAICASEDKIFNVEYTYPDSESNVWYRGSVKVKADTEEEALKIAEEKLQGADTFKISNKSYSNDDLITKDSPVKTFKMDWYYDGEKVRNEYTDSKEVESANKPFESTMGFYTYEVLWQDNDDKEGEFIEPIRFELCDDRDIDEWSWKCEELFGKEWFYGFLSRKDVMDKVIKELNKWGTIKGEIKQVDSLYTGRLKRLHSNYEQTTNTKEPYPNPSETPHDDIVLENHDGWVNTADNHFEYTEEQKRLLPLFKLVNEYVAKKQIQLTEDVQNEENTIATGQAEVINELEHKVKDLGFYCEPIAEITNNDCIGQDIYSLKIFTK